MPMLGLCWYSVCKLNCDLSILGRQRYAVVVVGCWIALQTLHFPHVSASSIAIRQLDVQSRRAIRGRSSGVHERRTTLTVWQFGSFSTLDRTFTYAVYRHYYAVFSGTYVCYVVTIFCTDLSVLFTSIYVQYLVYKCLSNTVLAVKICLTSDNYLQQLGVNRLSFVKR